MSRRDWEAGSVRLPTAEFSRVRKAVEDADRAHKEQVFDHTQSFWKGLTRKQQTDGDAYLKAAWDYTRALNPEDRYYRTDPDKRALASDVSWELLDAVGAYDWRPGSARKAPRRVLKSDIEMPTNRTTEFAHDEAVISFDRESSTVHYDSGENNRQVERARHLPMAKALMAALDTVRWTGRNTGGTFTGNDENNEDNTYAGGGANYTTVSFGPIGMVEAPGHCRPFTDSRGRHFGETEMSEAMQQRWRAEAKAVEAYRRAMSGTGTRRQPKGTPVGGQFAATRRAAPQVTLG